MTFGVIGDTTQDPRAGVHSRCAIDGGVDDIDTADYCSQGESEDGPVMIV